MRASLLGPARLVLLAAALVVVVGCQRAPTVAPASSRPSVSATELQADGDARRTRGDFSGALTAYRAALELSPNDLRLRYLIGVTLTDLDRRDEARVELQWVVDHGAQDREEVVLARQWLGNRTARQSSRGAGAASTSPSTEPSGDGRLSGKTEWKNLDADRPTPRLQLVLMGDQTSTKGRRYATMVRLNEPYQFVGVQPGEYRLLAQVGMKRLWDIRVTVQPGKPTQLDLTEASTVASPDILRARS